MLNTLEIDARSILPRPSLRNPLFCDVVSFKGIIATGTFTLPPCNNPIGMILRHMVQSLGVAGALQAGVQIERFPELQSIRDHHFFTQIRYQPGDRITTVMHNMRVSDGIISARTETFLNEVAAIAGAGEIGVIFAR